MNGLTKKQVRIFLFLINFIKERSYPPTIREICRGMGFASTSIVKRYLDILQAKGYIKKLADSPRAIEICKPFVSMAEKDDRRESPRVDVNIPIRYAVINRQALGYKKSLTEDISQYGLALEVRKPLVSGTIALGELETPTPEGTPERALALLQVVWCSARDGKMLAGVKILAKSRESEDIVRHFVGISQ